MKLHILDVVFHFSFDRTYDLCYSDGNEMGGLEWDCNLLLGDLVPERRIG